MFQHQGIWLPDGEKHFPEWMSRNGELVDGKGTYQIKKLRQAVKQCRNFRVAVDVGGHVGLWSMHLAKLFAVVHAFEPVPQYRECFIKNVGGDHVSLHPTALGAAAGSCGMAIDPADTGGTHVSGAGDVVVETLDTSGFVDVDFIKIDCEGYELEVLKGAVDTIARCQPAIIVEQKPHKLLPNFGIKGAPAVDFLVEHGYHTVLVMSGDHIMVPRA